MLAETMTAAPDMILPLALAGKLFVLWLLGVPGGLLILIFVLVKVFWH